MYKPHKNWDQMDEEDFKIDFHRPLVSLVTHVAFDARGTPENVI